MCHHRDLTGAASVATQVPLRTAYAGWGGRPELDAARRPSHDHGHMRRDLPAGTVTFLFTDVEGSTKLLHELGTETYAAKLAEHRRIVREACTGRGGVEVDTQGDAFFVAFPTAPQALDAAQAITEELVSGPITLRIGLHTGTPLLTEEGYVGEDVHFAARVAASAHGGQVVLSRATRALLDERYGLIDLGEHRLKDISDRVPIYQLGDGQFPPLKTISNTNLPRPASSFVGRERELTELVARTGSGARLLTLTGPGGSGKTRLALEAAASLVPEYKAGVFWVGLASLRDPGLVTETIAQTLGAKDGLADHIGEREMLLLLDNLEQVIAAAPELSSLLQACPNLTFLVTSRELLRVQGEVEYPVPPLAQAEAVSLFCERAQTAASEEIAELCRRLDNLPLAVELAAARAKALSPSQILARLSQRLDLLKGGRDADPRQQTLRATIEWSYELLSEEEQTLFRRLSVFVGGCTLEAAEGVLEADPNRLQSLVEKSLLRFSNERYWMLETIRDYAAESLDASDEADELRARFVHWLLEILTAARETIQEAETIAKLDAEVANIRAAAERLQVTARGRELIRLARYVWIYLLMRFPREARSLLEAAVALSPDETEDRARALNGLAVSVLNTSGDLAAAEEIARESVDVSRKIGFSERGGLNTLGLIATMQGRFEEARELYEESSRISERTGDVEGLRDARLGLVDLALNTGDFALAEALSEQALSSMGERGQYTLVVLINLAFARIKTGNPAGAVEALRESLEVQRELGPTHDVRYVLEGLAAVAVARDACRAATLLGASEAVELLYGGGGPTSFESSIHDETIEMLERTPRNDWQTSWEKGARLEPAEGIELGLDACAWLSRHRA
jgi:predicted ATPase/class 3 adenylate cyclase